MILNGKEKPERRASGFSFPDYSGKMNGLKLSHSTKTIFLHL